MTATVEARGTYDDVARAINMSRRYVVKHAREWPHHRFGRTYRFTPEDIAEIVKLHERTPKAVQRPDPHRPISRGARRRSA